MIRLKDLQKKVFNFMDQIFLQDRLLFHFDVDKNKSYILAEQTDAPRPSATSLLFYNLDEPVPFGPTLTTDTPRLNRQNGMESIDIWRSVKVNVSIVSKVKGAAKDAMDFLLAISQTSRCNKACYSATGFNFVLYDIDRNVRDLTALENGAWNERIDADLYFNFNDTIYLQNRPLISSVSSVELVKTKIDFDLEMKP